MMRFGPDFGGFWDRKWRKFEEKKCKKRGKSDEMTKGDELEGIEAEK